MKAFYCRHLYVSKRVDAMTEFQIRQITTDWNNTEKKIEEYVDPIIFDKFPKSFENINSKKKFDMAAGIIMFCNIRNRS